MPVSVRYSVREALERFQRGANIACFLPVHRLCTKGLRDQISDFNSECRALNHVLVEPDFVNMSTLPEGYPLMCYTLTEMRWGDFSLHTCPNNSRIRRRIRR